MTEPLDGIVVLDWTHWQMGTSATAMLVDLGATVIHIENRLTGDAGRVLNSPAWDLSNGTSAYFEICNRGKKGITVDLSKEKGRQMIHRLVKKADVFVHNYRQGVPEKLGMDYDTLSAINPMLIYAAASGYGPKGAESGEPSFDYIGMARTGMMYSGDAFGPPKTVNGGIADQMGGMMTAYGVMTALFTRERQGIGQKVDVSHLSCMIALQGLSVGLQLLVTGPQAEAYPEAVAEAMATGVANAAAVNAGADPRRLMPNPLWNHYPCKDGTWFALAMLQPDRQWPDVCKVLGLPHLIDDPRYENQTIRAENCADVVDAFDAVFPARTANEWTKLMRAGGDIICTPVQRISDLENDPQVVANNHIVSFDHATLGPVKVPGLPIALSKTPGSIKGEAPEFGQHTEEVLLEYGGYDWEEIGQLREEEVI